MTKILVKGTHGPEDPTRATLIFASAKAAKDLGHDVTVFLTNDAVFLIKDSIAGTLIGVGLEPLKTYFNALVEAKVPIYL